MAGSKSGKIDNRRFGADLRPYVEVAAIFVTYYPNSVSANQLAHETGISANETDALCKVLLKNGILERASPNTGNLRLGAPPHCFTLYDLYSCGAWESASATSKTVSDHHAALDPVQVLFGQASLAISQGIKINLSRFALSLLKQRSHWPSNKPTFRLIPLNF